MRRTLPIIAFLLLSIMQVCAQQKNYDFKEGKLFYKITDAGKRTVDVTPELDELLKANGSFYNNPLEGDIVIPNKVEHQGQQYYVSGIRDNAFGGCGKITSVSIPANVGRLGDQVFLSCTGLQRITVDPENPMLKDIDGVLFDKSGKKLLSFPNMRTANYEMPEGTVEVVPAAFFLCNAVETVKFPSTLKSIGLLAFGHCLKLREVTVPESVTELGDFAFYNCTTLEKAIIKADISEIKQYMFSRCTSLKEVSIPASVEFIRTWAFGDCAPMKTITLPEGLKGIDAEAFNGCTSLSEITLPEGLELLGAHAFDKCKALKSITCLRNEPLVEGVTMGVGVFDGVDKNLCELKVPRGHKDQYAAAEQWKEFTKITEHDLTGISLPTNQDPAMKTAIFTLNGQRLPANAQPAQGLYIINGKKVYVK